MILNRIQCYSGLIKRFSTCMRLKRSIINPSAKTQDDALYLFIRDKIKTNGPITVHEYMQLVGGSAAGYYVNKNFKTEGAIFGADGDFITSPELTQVFGELLAVWIYNELANTGHKGEWQLVELGPGTGTLMADMLGALRRFEEQEKLTVHLVEISDTLMNEQEKKLCGNITKNIEGKSYVRKNRSLYGVNIFWHRDINEIPNKFTAFIANEFLDALPIHQFSKTEKGWHEVYVNLDSNEKLKFMLSKGENLHTKGLLPDHIRNNELRKHWEVSPEAGTIVNQITERVTGDGGFALFVDYGHDGERQELSLRAYRKHALVDPLASPGHNDITADVNFGYLKSLIEDRVNVYGPVQQRIFLAQLGILARMEYLMKIAKTKEDRQNLYNAYKLLMSGNESGGMGAAFKCFSIFPKSLSSIIEKRGGYPDGFRPLT